ncbi:AmmeMemoRadiSam system radical SAM enzyme [Butyrivibrio sp. VCD2006]|uniref:AmmeMemoRadiSam system radical SAM enzyme n=1 Tax=Butyrivibrio sp. VCD2006 TaxID=1280664 RepID=UPI0004192CBC|nr:AmmeMemoRadiSam system radical SAM enzyme [Butyrivibrio sp. VCD2006]
MSVCEVCHNHCNLKEGMTGMCMGRICRDGKIICANYGLISSIALDPIEKKPFARFFPGSMVVSVGSYGCNLRCPFCQNHSISYGFESPLSGPPVKYISPKELVSIASSYKEEGNIGIAFTYNEPLIGFEYVRDTSILAHEAGLKTVLVSNGCVSEKIYDDIIPNIDAMNIDLKGFTDNYYTDVLHGDRQMVMEFIKAAAPHCHIELTTLIVPGLNDSDEEILELSAWIAKIRDDIPLHISRYFPRFHMTDIPATDVGTIYHLAEVARCNLKYVYTGNC